MKEALLLPPGQAHCLLDKIYSIDNHLNAALQAGCYDDVVISSEDESNEERKTGRREPLENRKGGGKKTT